MFPDPLRAFQTVVKTGSIRKAGDALGLAPSSVSRQIAILERQMGTDLFHRSLNGLQLTYAGQMVADYSENVVMGFDTLRSDLDDLKGSQRLIRLAMVESAVSAGPAQAITTFGAQHRNVTFDFEIMPAPAVVEAVRKRECDVGITFCAQLDEAIQVIARVAEPLYVLVPPDHPLASLDAVTLMDLEPWPVALPGRSFGVRRVFDNACLAAGVNVRPRLQSNSFEALRDFVRSNTGVAVLPKGAALREEQAQRARCLPLEGEVFSDSTLDLIVYRQRRMPRLVRLFIEALRISIETHR
ncbi:MAG: LysR family transcriptional regulator [Phenylobacterium sp.]|nr:LysR family transcriptional regulator [Phenylobacterium sp.]